MCTQRQAHEAGGVTNPELSPRLGDCLLGRRGGPLHLAEPQLHRGQDDGGGSSDASARQMPLH